MDEGRSLNLIVNDFSALFFILLNNLQVLKHLIPLLSDLDISEGVECNLLGDFRKKGLASENNRGALHVFASVDGELVTVRNVFPVVRLFIQELVQVLEIFICFDLGNVLLAHVTGFFSLDVIFIAFVITTGSSKSASLSGDSEGRFLFNGLGELHRFLVVDFFFFGVGLLRKLSNAGLSHEVGLDD